MKELETETKKLNMTINNMKRQAEARPAPAPSPKQIVWAVNGMPGFSLRRSTSVSLIPSA